MLQTISHFEIRDKIGEGGMGVVYLAFDLLLNRRVAIKVLSPSALADPERARRLVNEAHAASALNHPNVAQIYEIGEADGARFIVMEYVEGTPLHMVLSSRRLELPEILDIAIQTAEALAEADAKGITHRDIKPANIMLTVRGQVKMIDFGLAKLARAERDDQSLSNVSTSILTQPGMIMGTVRYMSPEQALGWDMDHRTDIFSLGAVLYEMATGNPPFKGSSGTETIDHILHSQPEPIPSRGHGRELERVVRKCLEKEPGKRYQHAEDLLKDLRQIKQRLEPELSPRRRERLGWRRYWWVLPLAGLACLATAAVYLNRNRNQPDNAKPPALTAIPLTTDEGYEAFPSFSPDGSQVTYSWDEAQDNEDIFVKHIGSGGPPVRLTSDPNADTSPAWSPDGEKIAFLRRSKLKIGELELFVIPPAPGGGPERKVAQLHIPISRVQTPRVAWTPDSQYLILPDAAGLGGSTALYLLSLATGEKKRLTAPSATMYGDSLPAVSPDGKLLAFVRYTGGDQTELNVLPLTERFEPGGNLRRVATEHKWLKDPAWTADGRDLIYFAYNLTPQSLTAPLLTAGRLWRVDISGSSPAAPLTIVGDSGDSPAVSARGNRLAYRVSSFDYDIWRLDISHGGNNAKRHRFLTSTRPDVTPQYSPDGKKIAFASARSGASEIWVCEQDGSNPIQLTWLKVNAERPTWFPDGRRIVFSSNKDGAGDLYEVDLSGGSPRRLTDDPAKDVVPSVSRDGRWIYFASTRSGSWQIWRIPVDGGQAVQVTREGGYSPVESADGRFLFYLGGSASTISRMSLKEGATAQLFGGLIGNNNFAVTKDGIGFVGTGEGGKPSMQFYAFATGNIRTIIDLENSLYRGVSISPDGQSILYSQRNKGDSDLMLVENFQ